MAKVMASQKMDVLPYCTKDIHTFYFAYIIISLYHFAKCKRAILQADEEGKKKFRRELLFLAFSAQIRIHHGLCCEMDTVFS